jgi:hypothetical protein
MVLLRLPSQVRKLGWSDGTYSTIEGVDAGESEDMSGERLCRLLDFELDREVEGSRDFDLARTSLFLRRDGSLVSE